MTFDDLDFHPHENLEDGIHATHVFPNGYGVSVVKAPFSFGGREGLYELAITLNGSICYTTNITDDVLGHLTEADVTNLLYRVERLPKRFIVTCQNPDYGSYYLVWDRDLKMERAQFWFRPNSLDDQRRARKDAVDYAETLGPEDPNQ